MHSCFKNNNDLFELKGKWFQVTYQSNKKNYKYLIQCNEGRESASRTKKYCNNTKKNSCQVERCDMGENLIHLFLIPLVWEIAGSVASNQLWQQVSYYAKLVFMIRILIRSQTIIHVLQNILDQSLIDMLIKRDCIIHIIIRWSVAVLYSWKACIIYSRYYVH